MSQHVEISGKTIKILAEVQKRLGEGGLKEEAVAEALQALLEGKPPGQSSLSQKTVAEFGGFKFTANNYKERVQYQGIELKRHHKGGGWVPVDQDEKDPKKAYIDDDVYIGPHVMVLGPAKIFGGEFYGGIFYGGQFWGGIFWGGRFYGGIFYGGTFYCGIFKGGIFIENVVYDKFATYIYNKDETAGFLRMVT